MKKSILENHDFILGVEKEWDSYFEVMVKFIEEIAVSTNIYHLFKDEKNEKYYLRSRYAGHQIEGVLVEGQIFVNLFSVGSEFYQADKKQSIIHATGVLKFPKG